MNTPNVTEEARTLFQRRALPNDKQLKIVLGVVVTAVLFLLVWEALRLFGHSNETAASNDANLDHAFHVSKTQLASLIVQPVEALSFRSEQQTDGKIALNGDTTTPVFSPYSGRIIKVIAGVSDYVKQGAPLFSIEASEFAQGQSDLLNAAAQLKLARTSEERKHASFDAKGGSLQDWQQAQADLAAARANEAAVRNRLRIFGKTNAEIDTLTRAKIPDPTTYVVAPIDGVVIDRQIGPGQYLQAGQSTPVYTIGDVSTVWLVANVRETDAPLIKRGQAIEVRVLAVPDQVFKAKLTSVGATVDPSTRRVSVRAVIDNRNGKLKPEMFAAFSIITSGETQAPAVPEEAIVYEGDTARVWMLESGDAVTLRKIRPGRTNGGMVEVLEGLSVGDKVITRGSLFIDRAARPN